MKRYLDHVEVFLKSELDPKDKCDAIVRVFRTVQSIFARNEPQHPDDECFRHVMFEFGLIQRHLEEIKDEPSVHEFMPYFFNFLTEFCTSPTMNYEEHITSFKEVDSEYLKLYKKLITIPKYWEFFQGTYY